MSIEVKIVAEDAAGVAQSVLQLAYLFAPNLRTSTAAPNTGEQVVETVAPAPAKPRGRKSQPQTIEHETKGDAADVRGGDVVGSVGGSASDAGDATGEGSQGSGSAGQAGATARGDHGAGAVEPDAPVEDTSGGSSAEVAAEPAEVKPEDYDKLRNFVISEWLHKHVVGQKAQGDAFRELLDTFDPAGPVQSMKGLSAAQIPVFRAAVEKKIADAVAAAKK